MYQQFGSYRLKSTMKYRHTERELRSNFFPNSGVYVNYNDIQRDLEILLFWRSFCLMKKNILAFNTRLFQCCKSRIPLHYIICQVAAQSWRAEINRFHSSFEGFWSHGWCYTNVSFRILSQTFRIKTALPTTSL